jgi:hypothetical protein
VIAMLYVDPQLTAVDFLHPVRTSAMSIAPRFFVAEQLKAAVRAGTFSGHPFRLQKQVDRIPILVEIEALSDGHAYDHQSRGSHRLRSAASLSARKSRFYQRLGLRRRLCRIDVEDAAA